MEKSIIIIGAGIAGLSAGCYARMNGYQTKILEMHKIPGGLCTAWRKKGYTFDISMHMLTGSVSGPFHRMWKELGITENFNFHYHDHLLQLEGMGKKLCLSVDRKKLEAEMMAISPGDSQLIKTLTHILFGPDMTNGMSLKPRQLTTCLNTLKSFFYLVPLLPFFFKYGKMSLQQFAEKFKHPFLRKAVRFLIDSPGWPMPDFPMAALPGFIKRGVQEAGVPLGGSQKVIFYLADLYKKMGGEIKYNSLVNGLIIEDDKVRGVKLWDGTEHRCDQVIWAGDGHTLHFDILGGKYLNEKIRKMYDQWTPVKPLVHVMIGVNRDFSAEPHRMVIEMDKPITIARQKHHWMAVIHHSFDPSMAPKGKSVVEVWIDSDYDYWESLSRNEKAYQNEKKRIAGHMIGQLEKHWPGFTSQIEVIDVPTPVTYHRYTNNWKGSPDGWYVTKDNLSSMYPVLNIPGLDGLYTAGQWTSPFTGTVIATLTGRQIIQLLCNKDGKKFMTNRKITLQQTTATPVIQAEKLSK